MCGFAGEVRFGLFFVDLNSVDRLGDDLAPHGPPDDFPGVAA